MAFEIEIEELFTDELAEKVTYRRGDSSVCVMGIPVESEIGEYGTDGELRVQVDYFDWMIPMQCLRFDGVLVVPKRGDTIERTNGEKFQVMPGQQDKTYRKDAHNTHYEVHSLRVES